MENKLKLIKPHDMIPVTPMESGEGDWYIIPNILVDQFLSDKYNEDMCDSGEFDNKYGQYMTGGDLNNIQLYADINDLK